MSDMQNYDANRKKNLGIPGNGGQWGSHTRTESLASLVGEPTAERIEFDMPIAWVEKNVLPTPRHRNPRDVDRGLVAPISIRSVTADEAPVGVTIDARDGTRELRSFGGELYVPLHRVAAGEDTKARIQDALGRWSYPESAISAEYEADSEEEAIASVQSRADDLLLLDGEIYEKTHEPVYKIVTFGMGGNHGGTSLMVDSITDRNDGFAASETYFAADDFEAARAAAIKTALYRGDTDSAARLERKEPEIHVDEDLFTPGCSFREAPRIEYRSLHEAQYEDGTNPQREFDRFHEKIVQIPGAVLEDGRIDASRLTEHQANDYKDYLVHLADTRIAWPGQ